MKNDIILKFSYDNDGKNDVTLLIKKFKSIKKKDITLSPNITFFWNQNPSRH